MDCHFKTPKLKQQRPEGQGAKELSSRAASACCPEFQECGTEGARGPGRPHELGSGTMSLERPWQLELGARRRTSQKRAVQIALQKYAWGSPRGFSSVCEINVCVRENCLRLRREPPERMRDNRPGTHTVLGIVLLSFRQSV